MGVARPALFGSVLRGEPRDCLRHILVEAGFLIGRSAGLSFRRFSDDEILRRAFM